MTTVKDSKIDQVLTNLRSEKISQGAEAIVYLTQKHPYLDNGKKCIVKYRPRKPYRYPILDLQIIKQRTLGESKIMMKLLQCSIMESVKSKDQQKSDVESILNGSVNCPNLIHTDVINGLIFMEYINDTLQNGQSSSLKNYLWLLEAEYSKSIGERRLTVQGFEKILANERNPREILCLNEKVERLLELIGIELANMHIFDVIHGDLTSSNIVLAQKDSNSNDLQPEYTPYLIDFGLSQVSTLIEDKAVDLFVLEKALESTHPLFAKQYTEWVLAGYEKGYLLKSKRDNNKSFKVKHTEVAKRLEAVRLRGRKRSMIG